MGLHDRTLMKEFSATSIGSVDVVEVRHEDQMPTAVRFCSTVAFGMKYFVTPRWCVALDIRRVSHLKAAD